VGIHHNLYCLGFRIVLTYIRVLIWKTLLYAS
jgi:hypothetical protein